MDLCLQRYKYWQNVQVSGTYTANLKFDFIDHEVKKAFEWLSAQERNEGMYVNWIQISLSIQHIFNSLLVCR